MRLGATNCLVGDGHRSLRLEVDFVLIDEEALFIFVVFEEKARERWT